MQLKPDVILLSDTLLCPAFGLFCPVLFCREPRYLLRTRHEGDVAFCCAPDRQGESSAIFLPILRCLVSLAETSTLFSAGRFSTGWARAVVTVAFAILR